MPNSQRHNEVSNMTKMMSAAFYQHVHTNRDSQSSVWIPLDGEKHSFLEFTLHITTSHVNTCLTYSEHDLWGTSVCCDLDFSCDDGLFAQSLESVIRSQLECEIDDEKGFAAFCEGIEVVRGKLAIAKAG
jgi:hypothetical protein